MINDPFGIHDKQNQASATSDNNLYGAPSAHNVFVPTPQPTPQLTPEPTLEPASEPTLQSAPQPTMESIPQPAPAEPASQPVLQPAVNSLAEATPSAPAFSSMPTFEPSTSFSTSEAYNASPLQQLPHVSEAQASATLETANLTMQSTLQPAVTSSGSSSASSTATDRFNSLAAQPAVTSASNFGVVKGAEFAGNASKPKSNKLITYSIAGVVVVVLAVAGVFGVKAVLRAQAYSGAIAAIDSVKNVAKKKEVNFSDNNSMTSDEMQDFFTKTGDAPDKTLFKAVKTPAEGIAKYRATMKQIINNRNTFDNKIVAEKVDATKEVYEKFINHADAATKFFKILNKYTKDMKEFNTNGINSNSPEYKKKMQKGLVLVKKLKAEMSSHKSSDKEFNKLANDLVDDLYNLVSTFAKEQPKGSSKQSDDMSDFGAVFGLMMKITDESKRLDTYFGDVANLRNQFIDSLADLRSTLVSKK